jgi:hypothetical protein
MHRNAPHAGWWFMQRSVFAIGCTSVIQRHPGSITQAAR